MESQLKPARMQRIRHREAVTLGNKTSQRWFLALIDLFSESLSPMLVLYPVMFVHVGVARATLLMLASTLLQTISARLVLEATRLQHGNLHLGKNEDFETLISESSNASNF